MSAVAGRVLPLPKGVYNAGTTYNLLDIVYYNNASYIAKGTTLGNLPTDTDYWQVLVDVPSTANITPEGLGIGYGVSDTVESDVRKVATLTDYNLRVNGIVAIKFNNNVPSSSLLNINNKGAKPIYDRGLVISDGVIKAGDTATFVYDGTSYNLLTLDRAYGNIGDLDNVDLTGLSDGQTLVYDGVEGKWKNGNQSNNLSDLNDVSVASIQAGEVLTFDGTANKWKNATNNVYDNTNSDLTATTNQDAIDQLEDRAYQNGVVNLCPTPSGYGSEVKNDVTFTNNLDGTWTVNGTATADTQKTIAIFNAKPGVKYHLSGCPETGSDSTYKLSIMNAGNVKATDYGTGADYNNTYNRVYVAIIIKNGTAIDNLTFKPMVTLASQKNSDYAHFTKGAYDNIDLSNMAIRADRAIAPKEGTTASRAYYIGETIIDSDGYLGVVIAYTTSGTAWTIGTNYIRKQVGELFAPITLKTVTADGVKTYGEMINALRSTYTSIKDTLRINTSVKIGDSLFRIDAPHASSPNYVNPSTGAAVGSIRSIWIRSTASSCHFYICKFESGTVTFSDNVNVVASQDVSLLLM